MTHLLLDINNPYVLDDYLVLDFHELSTSTLVKLASDEETSGDTLKWIFEHSSDYLVIYTLAKNKNTPSYILGKIVLNDCSSILESLESNPSTPYVALAILSYSENECIRIAVANNPSSTEDIMSRLSEDVSFFVRLGAAEHKNTPWYMKLNLLDEYYNFRNKTLDVLAED